MNFIQYFILIVLLTLTGLAAIATIYEVFFYQKSDDKQETWKRSILAFSITSNMRELFSKLNIYQL